MSDANTEGPGAVKRLRATLLLSAEEKRHGDRFILGLYVLINGAIAIGSLSALAAITHQAFVFPSLGPTAFILFFSAMSVQAAPRNVFLGHLVGVLAGAGAAPAVEACGVVAARVITTRREPDRQPCRSRRAVGSRAWGPSRRGC